MGEGCPISTLIVTASTTLSCIHWVLQSQLVF